MNVTIEEYKELAHQLILIQAALVDAGLEYDFCHYCQRGIIKEVFPKDTVIVCSQCKNKGTGKCL
jgi:hypothetical protein